MTTNAQTIAISLLKTARPRQWVKNLSLFGNTLFQQKTLLNFGEGLMLLRWGKMECQR